MGGWLWPPAAGIERRPLDPRLAAREPLGYSGLGGWTAGEDKETCLPASGKQQGHGSIEFRAVFLSFPSYLLPCLVALAWPSTRTGWPTLPIRATRMTDLPLLLSRAVTFLVSWAVQFHSQDAEVSPTSRHRLPNTPDCLGGREGFGKPIHECFSPPSPRQTEVNAVLCWAGLCCLWHPGSVDCQVKLARGLVAAAADVYQLRSRH